jgi:hypothetical protein
MRRNDAAVPVADFRSSKALGLWQEAIKIRQEWLDHGLSTQPADRQAAERSLTSIYAGISRQPPRFEWVGSPYQALPLIAGWPTLGQLFALIRDPRPRGSRHWPVTWPYPCPGCAGRSVPASPIRTPN